MLVFCEDCGERNVIDPVQVRAENNQYRCQVCNFLNPFLAKDESSPPPAASSNNSEQVVIMPGAITTDPPEPEDLSPDLPQESVPLIKRRSKRKTYNIHEDPHNRIFQKIAANDNILGAYIYHFSDGIIAYDIDDKMTEATVLQIGKALSVCSPYGQKILRKTKEIYLVLDDQVAVSKSITMNSLLVLLCNSYPAPPEVSVVIKQSIRNLQVFK